MVYEQRLEALRDKLIEQQMDAVLITGRSNVFYMSGFTGTSGDLFITLEKEYLLTDFRYIEQASTQATIFETIDIKEGLGKILVNLIQQENIKTVGFEDRHVTYAVFVGMKEKLAGATLLPIHGIISEIREIKQLNELELLRTAAGIADSAFVHVQKYIRHGVREVELAAELEYSMRKLGADGASFETIVASGVRGAMPHGVASEKQIEAGELITFDFGCIYKGYCSDITRTVAVGEVSKRQKEVYNLVHFAQLKALSGIKVGMEAKQLDALARRMLAQFNLSDYFGHSLGHGVGIDVHEMPAVNSKSETILKEGMVITVEPGVYIPGELGVRIEDTVAICADGIEILTKSPKEMLII